MSKKSFQLSLINHPVSSYYPRIFPDTEPTYCSDLLRHFGERCDYSRFKKFFTNAYYQMSVNTGTNGSELWFWSFDFYSCVFAKHNYRVLVRVCPGVCVCFCT